LVLADDPKKYDLKSLSIPKILKFLLWKNIDDSDPTNPEEPVIKAYFIKKNSLFHFYYLSSNYKFQTILGLNLSWVSNLKFGLFYQEM